jgi:ABC-type cobalamin/Fe3+-siderophores transport system ATPase subunit
VTEYRGARGSNTGDDYHELWATRHAIRLLDPRDPLEALAVEGLAPVDEASASEATWDGVDCTLYEGGSDAREADRIVLEQLKYSGANPAASWTVARLVRGEKREQTVLGRLARAWKGVRARGPGGPIEVSLITNQPVAGEVIAAIAVLAKGDTSASRRPPGQDATDEAKLAYAAGLLKSDLALFAQSLRFEGATGSRYAIEERLLAETASWADLELQQAVTELRRFIRNRMRPEFAGELITRDSVLLALGVSSLGGLFPCPPDLKRVSAPVPRSSVADAAALVAGGEQRVCLHGPGGIGKTTALQQVEEALPPNSVMITFDCYGGGSYLDAEALRHRPVDAFLQLTNDLATKLRLPILLGRQQVADGPRMFANRLRHAAKAHAAEYPDALIVIAIDAADNAVTAARTRKPPEPCFVHDFVRIGELPANVRFLVTARTGRLDEVGLSAAFRTLEISPFTRAETAEHVRRTWDPPAEWLDAFHGLTAGVPRVQAYAMDLGDEAPEGAIERLLPGGRSLDQVFREQFERALAKSGDASDLARFCASLIVLSRPVPLVDLAGVLSAPAPALADICADMAPAIRLEAGQVRFADEDFEHFVREQGAAAMHEIVKSAAAWLLARCDADAYAAQHVAGALVAAQRGGDLLELVEREPSPAIVADPVQRREAELTRVRLAISVCREAGDPARALRFVLIGGEGLKTERALRALLLDNPDLAVRFAPATAARLILTDHRQIGGHGAFLLHRQALHATAQDRASLREGGRLIKAWMQARREAMDEGRDHGWRLEIEDIVAGIEATLRARGAEAALEGLGRWRPKRIRGEVAKRLVPRMIAEGCADLLQSVLNAGALKPWEELFLLVPMAIAGTTVDHGKLAAGLESLLRRHLGIGRYMRSRTQAAMSLPWAFDTAMSAAELLSRAGQASDLVDGLLAQILQAENRAIASHHSSDTGRLDLLFRASTLQSARRGEIADPAALYEPRPEPVDANAKRRNAHQHEEDDRRLNEATRSVYDLYIARAAALVPGSTAAVDARASLEEYARHRGTERWRYSDSRHAADLAKTAAHTLLTLLATDIDHNVLADVAARVHGVWGTGDLAPDRKFASRLALCPSLHERLIGDVDESVRAIRGRRIGADDKSKALVAFARILLPISVSDANAVFNDAVEAASQLDYEILPQLRLLGSLFTLGLDHVGDGRAAARSLSEVMADAAVRLDGHEGLPWDEVMAALAALDLPLALANAAKWHDADFEQLRSTLPPVLATGLKAGTLQPASALSLDLLLHGDHEIAGKALDVIKDAQSDLWQFHEEAAWDSLIRYDHGKNDALAAHVAAVGSVGLWARAMLDRQDFLSLLQARQPAPAPSWRGSPSDSERDGPTRPQWSREVLLDAEALDRMVAATLKEARDGRHYIPASEVLGWAAEAVGVRDRTAFLGAVAASEAGVGGETMTKLLHLLDAWNSPGIRSWASSDLPRIVVDRFPEFVVHIAHGDDMLARAIAWTDLAGSSITDLLLRGIERHCEALAGDQVFALAGIIAARLDAADAAALGNWYVSRLADRIAPEDRDQTWDAADVPDDEPAAVARFLNAFLGDYDVRFRWRAAHAMRRLARLGAKDVLAALLAEYPRHKEAVFRSPSLEFYWIAARLYAVVAWDRIAGECPEIAEIAGPSLLGIAHDAAFPHVLVQSFARDACLKLADAERLSLTASACAALEQVGRTALPREAQGRDDAAGGGRDLTDQGRRFHFDPMDTIPYWYDPVLRGFARVSLEQLLHSAETWIIDRWGYPGDIRAISAERRGPRFSDRDWSLASNRHGSNPDLERLSTHLEWHALWCAVGELMRTEPLVVKEDYSWDDLIARIGREMLAEPPLWSADRRAPTPLRPDFWTTPASPVADWVDAVREERLRGELAVSDRSGYLVVKGDWRLGYADRVETGYFASALVDPAGAMSLLGALQSLDSAWDYKLPAEDESDFEHHEAPFHLVGWLSCMSAEGGIDEQDPLRGQAALVEMRPGKRVVEARGLVRSSASETLWSAPGKPPMFVYQSWGEREVDDRYSGDIAVSGQRLLVERAQLSDYLEGEQLDLVVAVEVRREGRGNRRGYDAQDTTPEASYDRLYRLDRTGGLHTAEGRVGAWAGDRPAA